MPGQGIEKAGSLCARVDPNKRAANKGLLSAEVEPAETHLALPFDPLKGASAFFPLDHQRDVNPIKSGRMRPSD